MGDQDYKSKVFRSSSDFRGIFKLQSTKGGDVGRSLL